MWLIILLIVIIVVVAVVKSSRNDKQTSANNNMERNNSVQFYIKTDEVQIVTVDFTTNSVIYNDIVIGTYSVDSDGWTTVITKSNVKIRYNLDGNSSTFCTFINESKNNRLTSYRTSIKGYELVGPTLEVKEKFISSTPEDDLLASYCGDKNGAVATFVSAYTEIFSTGKYHDYFTS